MASPWPIGESRPGYCAATDGEEPGDCVTGESGSWSTSGIRGLDECATRCLACARCRFVTYGEDDCSWYATCDELHARSSHASRHIRDEFGAPPSPRERCGYATLLSHASFVPGALAMLTSLRAGGAQLPATVVATPSALHPASSVLLRRHARLHVVRPEEEARLTPSAKVIQVMNDKPSECAGVEAHERNASGLAAEHDCSRWQRLRTFVKLLLFLPNVTRCELLLHLDADTVVAGNLDGVFTTFPYALRNGAVLSAVGDIGYWNSGVMLMRPSERLFEQLASMVAAADYRISDDPGDQDAIVGWAQRHRGKWQPLPGKLNLRVSHPGVTAERWAALSEPKVLHFAHHPKPWIAWLGAHRGGDAHGGDGGAGAWLRRAWPRIEWGEGDRGVRERMSTREKEWAMRAWRGAWSAVHEGLELV